MSGTITVKLLKKINKEELLYGFSKKEILEFLKNRVVIYYDSDKMAVSISIDYKAVVRFLEHWCHENCEGFFMLEAEYNATTYSCFYFQLDSDAVQFKLVHNTTEFIQPR